MTYSIKVVYYVDSAIEGDSCLRSETVHIDADNSDDAFESLDTRYDLGDIKTAEIVEIS